MSFSESFKPYAIDAARARAANPEADEAIPLPDGKLLFVDITTNSDCPDIDRIIDKKEEMRIEE